MPIDCFKLTKIKSLSDAYNKQAKEGMSDKELRDLGTKLALDYFNKLDRSMSRMRNKLGNKDIKHSPVKYTPVELEVIKPTVVKKEVVEQDNITHAVKEVNKGRLAWSGDPYSSRIDLGGLSRADIRKGEADIKKGNYTSVPAKRVIEALNDAKKQGYYDYMEGTGGKTNKVQVPLTETLDAETEISAQDLKEINTNEEQLSNDYGNWLENLDEKTLNEIYENETTESGVVEEQPITKGESKKNVSNKQEAVQERKNIANAKIDEVANWLKQALPKVDLPEGDTTKQQGGGMSQDQLIDLIAKASKSLVSATIDIDTAIKQVIETLKQKFDFEVDVENVKAKISEVGNKVKQTQKETSGGEKKQSRLSERFLKGNNKELVDGLIKSLKLNNTELDKTFTEKIPKFGLVEYEQRKRETVYNNAVKFVDKAGVFGAYNAIENGDIKNADTKNAIYAIVLERQSQEIINIVETLKEDGSELGVLSELSDFFEKVQSDYYLATVNAGQGTSMIAYLLEKGHFVKYDLSNQIALEKQRNGGEISTKRIKELRDRDKKIKEQDARIKELEDIQEKAKAQNEYDRAIEFENLLRDKFKNVAKTQKITKRSQVQGVINKLDALEKKLRSNSYSDSTLITPILINGITVMKASIKIGANAYDVIEKGIENIKKELDKIGKKLPNELELREDLLNAFLEEETTTPSSKEPVRVEDGKIIISRSVLRELVEEGILDIDDAAKTVRERNLDILEDFTIREVRDALTDYGKTRELDKGEISTKIRELKRLGVLLSKMEDAERGERPLRTGVQRDATTPLEREYNKLLNDLLDKLPVDQVDLEKRIKTALDKRETTLRNAIEDLDLQIQNQKRTERTVKSKKTSDEIERLEAIKKAKQEELTSIVGIPVKTLEQKLQTRKNQLDTQIKKLDEDLSKNDIGFKEKFEPVSDAEIEAKLKTRNELIAQRNELRETQGIIEQQRLKVRKIATKKAIEERYRRIREKDFSKKKLKPLKEDSELRDLRRANERLKEKYDIEAEKDRLRNRDISEKARDFAKGLLNAFRAVLLTLEMSFIGIQGFVLMTDKTITRRNISNLKNKVKEIKREDFKNLKSSAIAVRDIGKSIESFKALSESLGSMYSEYEHKNSEIDLQYHPRYDLAKKHVQFVVDNGLQDEHFVGTDFVNDFANLVIQSPLRYAERNVRKLINKKYPNLSLEEQNTLIADTLVKLNPLKAVERGNARFLNDLRMGEFVLGVEALELAGKSEETHPQDYKALGMMVNTVTGTTSLNPLLKQSVPLLNMIFLAFRFTVSMANQSVLAPFHFAQLRGENWADDIKKGKISYAQKRYAKLMTKSYAMIGMATYGLYWASMMAWMDDDDKKEEDKPRIEFDMRSSDFMSVIEGNVATSVLGSRKKWFVFTKRMLSGQTKNGKGVIVENGVGFNSATDLDIALNFMTNHLNVVPGYVAKYWAGHNETIDGVERRVNKFKREEDVDFKTQILGTYPLIIGTSIDLTKEDPYMLKPLMISSFIGLQTSIYDRKKNSGSVIKNRPKSRDTRVK